MPIPLVSVIISNKNGAKWLSRCFESLSRQTIAERLEIIVVDNRSEDDSAALARKELAAFPRATVIENAQDLGFTGGNNVGADAARGELAFFLNNDAWLEPDCLEKLIQELEAWGADAASPLVLNYDDDTFQCIGSSGLDLFGLADISRPLEQTAERFTITGCGFLMRTEIFRRLGGFDMAHFIYAEETDLSWRIWIAGGKVIGVPSARMHHRGAAGVNPAGYTKIIEARTSETKRYLANRNGILFLLKNSQHVLLLLLIPHLLLLLVEALVSVVLVRRWSYVRRSYLAAVADAFRMRSHIREWRRKISRFRRRGDFWMLRFLQLRLARWDEIKRIFKFGLPRVDAK
ncbi:MAG: glycosyltransferase family 2 protein [Verrucomicrobiota bacterium]